MTEAEILALSPDALAALMTGPPGPAAQAMRVLAKAGVAEAQARYGQMLLDGHGVPADPVHALSWFKLCAATGHAMGQNMVGRCYENGWGTPKDPVEAAVWYRRAAGLGLDWGMYNYATALTLGEAVPQDRAEAFAWFSRAAALGHAKSHNIVGGFYEDGWEVRPDLAKAREHYRLSAEGGDFRGQFNLGRLLVDEGDDAGAIALFRQAATTATPAFRLKMAAFLAGLPSQRISALAVEIA